MVFVSDLCRYTISTDQRVCLLRDVAIFSHVDGRPRVIVA